MVSPTPPVFLGSVWIELPDKLEPEDEGDVFNRAYERGAGKAIRLLGKYKVRCLFNNHRSDMASIEITFNSGEKGKARAKVGKHGYINVYS